MDLLKRIAEHSSIHVNLTITTLKTRLARMLEPCAPRPDLRLGAVRELRTAGISAGVFVMPVLPGLTDEEADLDALARASRDAGAQWFAARVLYLTRSSQKQFLPFLEKKFPKLARRYREWFSRSNNLPVSYRREISGRIAALRQKYGLGEFAAVSEGRMGSPQLSLGLEMIPTAKDRVGL